MSYFLAKANTTGKYANNGDIGLVIPSPILNAICVNAGEYPNIINIGTNIGAIIAHFADALPMNKLIIQHSIMNPIISGTPLIFAFCKNSAPFTDKTIPRLLSSNNFKN